MTPRKQSKPKPKTAEQIALDAIPTIRSNSVLATIIKEVAAEKRQEVAQANAPTWNPQRGSQYAFHASPIDELLYGGAAGGGKSDSLIIDALEQTHIPGYSAIIFRRTYPEIEKSLVPRAYEIYGGRAKPRNKGMDWHFPNGSTIYLSHMQREEDKEKHKSAEYDYIGFDEVTSFAESQYVYMFSRLRGSNKDIKRYMRGATNPTGPGHGWVKDRFLMMEDNEDMEYFGKVEYEFACGWRDPSGKVHTSFSTLPENFHEGNPEFSQEFYKVYKNKNSGLTRAFIPALLWGNSILLKSDPGYKKRLMELPIKTQEALLYGSWDLFEGQFFSTWDPDKHVVDAFDIPDSWRKFVAIDYGYTAPFCALWFALDEDGNVYCYRELYGKKLTTDEQASQVLSLSQDEKIEWFTADPSMFARQGTGESHADVYGRHKLYLIASSNKRVPGWALLHEYLANGKIKFFKNCVNTIRTIPTLVHAKHNPEDLNTHQEDHAVDAIRYMLLTFKGLVTNISTDPQEYPDWWHDVQARKKKRSGIAKFRWG